MSIDLDKLNTTKAEARDFYQNIGKVKCPYFGEDIQFNSEGFEHLLFKAWNKTRSVVEQYTRLRLLKLVPSVIQKARTLQEYNERKLFVRQKINSRWEKRMKTVRYYGFVAIVGANNDCRIKIIIKEIEGGAKFFWSLYPSWKVGTDLEGKKQKILHSGNLEED